MFYAAPKVPWDQVLVWPVIQEEKEKSVFGVFYFEVKCVSCQIFLLSSTAYFSVLSSNTQYELDQAWDFHAVGWSLSIMKHSHMYQSLFINLASLETRYFTRSDRLTFCSEQYVTGKNKYISKCVHGPTHSPTTHSKCLKHLFYHYSVYLLSAHPGWSKSPNYMH